VIYSSFYMVDIWKGKNYYYYYGKKTNSRIYISVSIHYKRGITLKILDKKLWFKFNWDIVLIHIPLEDASLNSWQIQTIFIQLYIDSISSKGENHNFSSKNLKSYMSLEDVQKHEHFLVSTLAKKLLNRL
jgi:hypothetical protein